MPRIFVNFRNGDDNYAAALIYDELATVFGAHNVFRSSDSLRAGQDFTTALVENVRRCKVMVVVIGTRWLDATDGNSRKRLTLQTDWVRREIALALSAGKIIIPVLLHGVPRLTPQQLPPSIRALATRQSVVLDHRGLRAGLVRLAAELSHMIPELAHLDGNRAIVPTPARLLGAVNREHLLSLLDSAFATGADCAIVVLQGRPGSGKTQLAVEHIHRHDQFHHATWWVSAGRPELLAEQFADLAAGAGLNPSVGYTRICREMNRRGRWLLVLDDLPDTADLNWLVAARPDRVLVTSRDPRQSPAAIGIKVSGFTREESISILTAQVGELSAADADVLADVLDDLPLGVAQAAAFLRSSTIGPRSYRDLLTTNAGRLLDRGVPAAYPTTLARTWSLALEMLATSNPAAAELAKVCAYFAPAAVPIDWFVAASTELPPPLRSAAADPLDLDDAAVAVARSGLVELRAGHLRPHALFQSYLRDRTVAAESEMAVAAARIVLCASHPGDPRSAESWPTYAVLLPHIFELELVASEDPRCQRLLLDASHYLVVRGDAATAMSLLTRASERWRVVLGDEHETIVLVASHLARAHFRLGDYRSAEMLDEQVLDHRRRTLGPVHPRTLDAEHDLAADLSALARPNSQAALDGVVRRRREILGGEHPDTLRSAHNLAVRLRADRLYDEALRTDERNLAAFRRTLGDDHVDTLRSACAVGIDLRRVGAPERAVVLDRDTLARMRHVFGADHIETLRCANNLAQGLHELGRHAEAAELDQDNRRRLTAR